MSLVRNITSALDDAFSDTPVIVIQGARQSGKSTLAQAMAHRHSAPYITLDDITVLGAASNDPTGFIDALPMGSVIDEIQRAPDLMLAIKADVDRNRTPGRFLLTGSSHVLSMPKIADTLAGRLELLTLWPLSQGELKQTREGFIDTAFADAPLNVHTTALPYDDIVSRILRGGYPEIIERDKPDRRRAWFDSYISTVIQREVRDLANIDGLTDMPRLLHLIAGRVGGLVNYSDLARDAGLNPVTFKRYFTLLNAVFLVHTVRPWHSNRMKRTMKSEKVFLADTGLLTHLLDATATDLDKNQRAKSALFENFVALELAKQRTWSVMRPNLYHYRGYDGQEVDLVLESPNGAKLIGVEVKSARTVHIDDFDGLRYFSSQVGPLFHRGIVFYAGRDVVPFGKNLIALPLQTLWIN